MWMQLGENHVKCTIAEAAETVHSNVLHDCSIKIVIQNGDPE